SAVMSSAVSTRLTGRPASTSRPTLSQLQASSTGAKALSSCRISCTVTDIRTSPCSIMYHYKEWAAENQPAAPPSPPVPRFHTFFTFFAAVRHIFHTFFFYNENGIFVAAITPEQERKYPP